MTMKQGNTVKIYQMDVRELEDETVFQKYYEELSAARRKKVDRHRTVEGKRLSLGAGVLLDRGLQAYGLREKDVRIEQGENGKPYLKDYPEICFNLSHSRDMVLAAFAPTEVGCDIEFIGETNLKLAKRFFCPEEYEYLLNQPDKEAQRQEFYRLWTLKESFMKVTGLGMKLPLNAFCFELGEEVHVRHQLDRREYIFSELQMEEYRAAVCWLKDE